MAVRIVSEPSSCAINSSTVVFLGEDDNEPADGFLFNNLVRRSLTGVDPLRGVPAPAAFNIGPRGEEFGDGGCELGAENARGDIERVVELDPAVAAIVDTPPDPLSDPEPIEPRGEFVPRGELSPEHCTFELKQAKITSKKVCCIIIDAFS